MCTGLILPDGTRCETAGDLAAAIGWDNIPVHDGDALVPETARESCLCPVDFEALAARMGWRLDRDDPLDLRASVDPDHVRPAPAEPAAGAEQLWEILVPTTPNGTKSRFPLDHHRAWDARVREIAGGLTILKSAKGQWLSPDGALFVKRMIPVRVLATRAQMDRIAAFTAEHYDQKAVLFYRLSNEAVIHHRGDGDPAHPR